MKGSNALFLFSLLFFLTAGVFFAVGQGWLAALDVALGIGLAAAALLRRRRGR